MRKVTQDLIEISASPKKNIVPLILIIVSVIMMTVFVYNAYEEYKKPSYVKEVIEMQPVVSEEAEGGEMSAKQTAIVELERERMNRRYDMWEMLIASFFKFLIAAVPSGVALYIKRSS